MLCFHLYRLSMEEVRSLEDANVIPHLRLRDAPDRDEACDQVRDALESCDSHHQRLHQMASTYCWLFPRNQRIQWALFALDERAPPVDDFTLQMLIATALTFPGVDIGYVPVSLEKERYACAITAEQQSDPDDAHIVVGMCAWQDLPYLAICLPGKRSVRRIEPVLESILDCKSDDMFVGCYAGIDETLAQAGRHYVERETESDSALFGTDTEGED